MKRWHLPTLVALFISSRAWMAHLGVRFDASSVLTWRRSMKAFEFARGWLLWSSIAVLVPAVCAWAWASDEVANIRSVRRYKRSVRRYKREIRDKLRASGRGSARL
jgi:hypothetical protein